MDSGREYTSIEFETYLCREGIHHQLTAPHTSAQNRKAEHCHHMIMNRACAILSNANLPPSLWCKCIRAARYLKNITTTRTLRNKTPYEAWYNKCPNVSHLHKLGCKAWVFIMDNNPKIYNRSVQCVLVGYYDN